MARVASRTIQRSSGTLPFWTALQVITIPFVVLMVLPFILSYLYFNNFFLLLLNILLVTVLCMVWFTVSRESLKKHGWKSPEKRLLFALFAGLIPFVLLTHTSPFIALLLFACTTQSVLLINYRS